MEAGTLAENPVSQAKTIYFANPPFGTARAPEEETPFVRSYRAASWPQNAMEASGGGLIQARAGEGLIQDFTTWKKVISHKGGDTFEVLWSTEVTMAKELKKPIVEGISHIGRNCAPIS